MPRTGYVKINGEPVQAEWIEPGEVPFLANPRVQDTALFIAGVGLGGYRMLRNLAGVSLNPTMAGQVRRALPWVAAAAIAVFLAPAAGRAKTAVRIGAALLGLKAVNELVRKETEKQGA